MKYYIFRHGETFETKHNLLYGNRVKTAEILPEGIPTIERLAKHIQNIESDFNISSPFIRCKQTVGIVEKITQKTFKFEEKLGEYLELEETFDQMARRVKQFIDELSSEGYKNVIICTHGGIIAALTHHITEGSFEEHQLYDFPKPGVLISIEDGKMTKRDFN